MTDFFSGPFEKIQSLMSEPTDQKGPHQCDVMMKIDFIDFTGLVV